MITTMKLVNTSVTSRGYLVFCLCVMKTFKVYFLSSFQIRNTMVPTIVAVLYVTALELISLITHSLCPLTPQPLATTMPLCFSEFGFLGGNAIFFSLGNKDFKKQ